jgi:hypothetical protein
VTGPGRLPMGRLALLLPGGVALLAGLDASLLLLGLPAPLRAERLPSVHGVLLVLGFVGTLVALERAVALRRPWGYLAPAGLGVGGLLLLAPLPLAIGEAVLVVGAAALVLVYVPLWRRQPADATVVQAFGAVLATGGALLWLGDVPVPWLLPWLVGFLVLTIAGERLELARVASPGPRAESVLTVLALLVATGAVAALLWPAAGYVLFGGALLALTAWLVRHDVARHTVHGTGLPRFVAVCLLSGLRVAGGRRRDVAAGRSAARRQRVRRRRPRRLPRRPSRPTRPTRSGCGWPPGGCSAASAKRPGYTPARRAERRRTAA